MFPYSHRIPWSWSHQFPADPETSLYSLQPFVHLSHNDNFDASSNAYQWSAQNAPQL